MVRKPFPDEWARSQLPAERRAYLDSGLSFEEITTRMLSKKELLIPVRIKPYDMPARGEPKNARQVIFLVSVRREICDLLYNAPDGLRSRYWQSPDLGFAASRHLIDNLMDDLISFAKQRRPILEKNIDRMSSEDIRASLVAPSAKIWPRECDDAGNRLFARQQLVVPRWEVNEKEAPNGVLWRDTPTGGDLEIKGALLGPDRTEYAPREKRSRSCHIHCFGFT